MLKYLLMVMFLIPLSGLNKESWWLVQLNKFILIFILICSMSVMLFTENISMMFGCDMISYGMILLSVWVSNLMLLSSQKIYDSLYDKLFLMLILLLMFLLMCAFMSLSLLMFYIFFEASLVPTLLLILGWGYQPERIQAGIYLLFYTLFASMPLLISILYIYNCYGMLIMMSFYSLENISFLFYLSMIMAFLVKMPIFLFHLWLPKAHVEAPVSGSMILAGVLLKLGGYGIMRVFVLMYSICIYYNIIWIIISLLGGLMISLLCLCQIDMKSLIAYSSVVHMGLVVSGLMTMNHWGFYGSYVMMIGHGLCSSGLFCLVNILYERMGSRSMLINKGMLVIMPSMGLWWFLLSSSNMAAPPSLNLLGEILLINSIISWSDFSMIMIALMSFLSASYSLYLYSYIQHGNLYSGMYCYMGGYFREYLLMFMHWVPLNLLIIKSDMFLL
uniref:NADH-ubiquinone oxidoreductase chain 4 n=1 Tax=Oecanthus sinensis TaxID=1982312 RepID=A0A1W6S5W4_9ORTH|nr:NADH dehydrogenase subunit 4 [Oecanthus sinensis]ARO75194.1 NADH dehydrogenase subunit 4 [Oecanthus sinensis]